MVIRITNEHHETSRVEVWRHQLQEQPAKMAKFWRKKFKRTHALLLMINPVLQGTVESYLVEIKIDLDVSCIIPGTFLQCFERWIFSWIEYPTKLVVRKTNWEKNNSWSHTHDNPNLSLLLLHQLGNKKKIRSESQATLFYHFHFVLSKLNKNSMSQTTFIGHTW